MIFSSASAEKTPSALWHYVPKLLRLRLTLMISNFKRAKVWRKIGVFLLTLLVLAILVGVFFLSLFLLRLVHSPELRQFVDPEPFLAAIPTLIYSGAFLIILMTNFGVLLQALYLSNDMDFLMSAPIPMRAVFLSKLLEGILPNFGVVCLFSLPILFGLGFSKGATFLYYPMVILLLAGLALAAGGLASLLVMAVVKVAPARRVAEVLGFLGATLSFFLSQSGQFTRNVNITDAQLVQTLHQFTRIDVGWSPFAWAGRGTVFLSQMNWGAGFGFSILSLAFSVTIFMVSLRQAEHWYYSGWSAMKGSSQKKKTREPDRKALSAKELGIARLVPAVIRGMVVKDFLVLRRDLNNLSQLITPLIFGFMMLFASGRSQTVPVDSSQVIGNLRHLGVYTNISLSLFVSWMLGYNLAANSFSREGRNYWILQAAPIKSVSLVIAKFLVSYLPTSILGVVFITISNLLHPQAPIYFVYSVLVILLSIGGLVGVALAFGIQGAHLDWQNPRNMGPKGATGCLGVIASFGYLLIGLVFFLLPSILWEIFNLPDTGIGLGIGLVLGAAFSVAATIIPISLVLNRVQRIGQGE